MNIQDRLQKLEARETRIEQQEEKILAIDEHILEEIEKTRKETKAARILYRFRFVISILLSIGVALIWLAVGKIADTLPLVSTAIGALVIGLLILFSIERLTRIR